MSSVCAPGVAPAAASGAVNALPFHTSQNVTALGAAAAAAASAAAALAPRAGERSGLLFAAERSGVARFAGLGAQSPPPPSAFCALS